MTTSERDAAAGRLGKLMATSRQKLDAGDFRGALAEAEEGLAILATIEPELGDSPIALLPRAVLKSIAVEAARELGDASTAVRESEHEVDELRARNAPAYVIARALNHRAVVRIDQGRYLPASADLEEAERLLVADGPDEANARLLEIVRSHKTVITGLRDDDTAARRPDLEIEQLRAELAMPATTAPERRRRGIAFSNLGMQLKRAGRRAEAIAAYQESLRELTADGSAPEPAAIVHASLGNMAIGDRDLVRAETHLKTAWDLIRAAAPDGVIALRILCGLGTVRYLQRDLRRTAAITERAMALYERLRPELARSEAEHRTGLVTYRQIMQWGLATAIHENRLHDIFAMIERTKGRLWLEADAQLASTPAEDARFLERIDDMKHVVGINGVALNFYITGDIGIATASRNARAQAHPVPAEPEAVEAAVSDFVAALTSSSRRAAWYEAGLRLSDMLLGRVRFDDWNIATLVVLPDGPLWRVPFHALPVPSHWPGAEQRRLLGEIAPVVVVPSLTAYQRFQNRAQKRAPFHALIVSDPDTGGSAPPLDAAALEAQGIAAIYGDAAPIVSGRAATPDALWAGMQDRDVLHLIAHGLTDEANGDAWILFSDGRGGATRLALGDLANRRMALQTVFLSACSTGAGRESVGEGLMSVARAFLMAGARSVVASLWPISDRDAPAFVAEFHEQLQGGSSVAAALGTAAARARERKAHPRLWAAFQAYGDGHGRLARNRIADLLKGDSGGDRV